MRRIIIGFVLGVLASWYWKKKKTKPKTEEEK